MELIGLTVKHGAYGVGVITEHSGVYMTVEFEGKTAKFVYPTAFETFLKAENPDIHAAIIQEIKDAKAVAKQKQAEEAARKAAATHSPATTAATAPRGKKTRSLDERFSADYHVEKLARHPILTYQQVENQFGIRISGFGRGINPTSTTVVLISSIGSASGNFVYHDKWTADGDYLYSGEGRTGDQIMTKGNLAIKNAAQDGKKIHLFVKFSPQEYYYQGVFVLADYAYEDEKDESGNTRKEYKFRLRKVTNE